MVNLIIIVPLLSILCSTFADNNKQYQFFRSKHDVEFSRPVHQHFNLHQSADRQQRNLSQRKHSLNTLTQEARSIQSNQDRPQLRHEGVQVHQERPHSRQGGQQVHQGVHHVNQNQHGVAKAHQGIPKHQQGVFSDHQKKLHQGALKNHQGVSQIKQGVPQNGQRLPQFYRGATQNVKSQHHNIQHEKRSNLANQKQALRHPQQSHHPSILSNKYQHTPHPQPVLRKLTTNKKTVDKPSSPVLPRITNKVPRKIDQTPLKLSKNNISSEKLQNSFKTNNAEKKKVNENEAEESKPEVTKVKAPKQNLKNKKVTPVKPAKEEKRPDVAEHRDYKVASKPKFIIKPAGPSQQYGWVGHGHYGPLNLQNIFRQAGINTQWISGEDTVFETGLTYPAPPSKHQPPVSNYSPPANEHHTTKTHTTASPSYAPSTAPVSTYSPPIAASSYVAPTISAPVYIPASPSLPEYKPPVYIPKSTLPPVYSAAPAQANLPVYQETLFRETAASSAPVYDSTAPAYEAPAAAPAYEAPAYKAPAPAYEAPAYEAPATAPAYKAPAPAYEAPAPAPEYDAPSPEYDAPAPAYEAPATAPAYEAPSPTSAYEAPAQASAPANSYFGPQSTFESASDENTFDLYNSPSSTASPPVFTFSSPSPSYPSPSIQNNYASPQFNFPGESGYIFPLQSYQQSPSPPPFIASPSPASYQSSPSPSPYQGSPSPAPYQPSPSPASYQPSPSPAPYQPSPSPAFYQPSPTPATYQPSPSPAQYQAEYQKPAPFTAFKSFNSPSPSNTNENVPVPEIPEPLNNIFLNNNSPISEIVDLRTSQSVESIQGTNGLTPESDVFYIYYENENQAEQDEVDVGKLEDAEPYSGEIFRDDNVIPSFSLNEENDVPLFYDIPLRVEENGEGFDPPSEIRTIYVPVENAINVPSSFDINVGTTLGKSKNKPGSSFPNFPNYNSGSGSPKQGGVDVYESEGVKIRRPVRRPQSPVVFQTEVIDENNVSSVPFGTRLSPREQYDPLTLRR